MLDIVYCTLYSVVHCILYTIQYVPIKQRRDIILLLQIHVYVVASVHTVLSELGGAYLGFDDKAVLGRQ